MHFTAILALSVALAMDALAVALATGIKLRCTFVQTARMSVIFGGFQAFMPILGWLLGLSVREYIENFDHWIAFGLLSLIGLNMLREGWQDKEEEECVDPTKGVALLILGLATSIDALAVGLSMSLLRVDIWFPAAVIGVVCFFITAMGIQAGRLLRGSGKISSKAGMLGGLVLIGIGVKILLEHGVFS